MLAQLAILNSTTVCAVLGQCQCQARIGLQEEGDANYHCYNKVDGGVKQ